MPHHIVFSFCYPILCPLQSPHLNKNISSMLGCAQKDWCAAGLSCWMYRGWGGGGYPLSAYCNGTCDLTKLEMSACIAVRAVFFVLCTQDVCLSLDIRYENQTVDQPFTQNCKTVSRMRGLLFICLVFLIVCSVYLIYVSERELRWNHHPLMFWGKYLSVTKKRINISLLLLSDVKCVQVINDQC